VQIEPTGDDATLLSFHQTEAATARQQPPRQARQSLSGSKRRTTTPPPSAERRAAASAAANLLSDYASSDEDNNDDEATGTFDRLPAKRPSSSAARPSVWFDEEVVVIPTTPTISVPPPPPPTTVTPAAAVPAMPPPPVSWSVPATKIAPEPLQVASNTRLVSAAPDSREELAAQQETMRSATRNVLDELRRGDIPFYDADKNDAARTVIIDQPVFTALHQDSAFEFQDANRMPWVPRAPNAVVDRVRNWHVIETLRELDQRKKPWYTMVSLVAGFLKVDVDQLVVPAPGTASANAARPTRNSVRGVGFGGGGGDDSGGGGGASQVGLTGGAATTALANNMTVFRDDGGFDEGFGAAMGAVQGKGLAGESNAPPPGARKRPEIVVQPIRQSPLDRPAGTGAAGGAAGAPAAGAGGAVGGGVGAPAAGAGGAVGGGVGAPAAGGAAGGGGAPARPLTLEEQVSLRLDLTAEQMRAFSRGQFADFRDARRSTEWYETSNQEAAIKLSRDLRVAGAQAQAWITRPVATGIYYLNNNYVAARDEAWMLITSRADQLSAVPIEAFIAEDERDPVQARVRIQFAKLIATLFNFHRYNSSRFVKLAHDAANHAAQSTDILSYFVNRITYNTQSGRFADTGARAAINHQPAWLRRPLGIPSLPSSVARFDPLLAQPPPSRASASMLISRW
jgi:hypothetical protein